MAGLVFGNVRVIKVSVDCAVVHLDRFDELGFECYCWVRVVDLWVVVVCVRECQVRYGSLGAHFLIIYECGDIRGFLSCWVADLCSGLSLMRGVVTLIINAVVGSVCKCLNFMFRWFVWSGLTDLGLWSEVDIVDFVIFLDVYFIVYACSWCLIC